LPLATAPANLQPAALLLVGMNEPVYIDGSQGEGGGQIVRSSLALALVTGRPVSITRVRAARQRPGLMRQHLAAVHAAVAVCGGQAQGAALGSQTLWFEPRPVRAGEYRFDVGSAGSATLVLQTVLPALLVADGPSKLVLEGGTHNPWAPPFDFITRAFLPLVSRMGPRAAASLESYGFYPAGGGRISVTVEPCRELAGFDLPTRGKPISHSAWALVSNLPVHIGRREIDTILAFLGWDEPCGRVESVQSCGPGNVVFIELVSEHITEVFAAFGRKGVRAEAVAREAVAQVQAYLAADAPVGPYLADQLLLPLGISAWQPAASGRRRGGSFRTLPLSLHAATHIDILRQFLGIEIRVEPAAEGKSCRVELSPPVA
jgi:RNA 3'-terminal phosphate cyclase (ATP)